MMTCIRVDNEDHCPNCDTPMEGAKYDGAEEDLPGCDVWLRCTFCGFGASTSQQGSLVEAWEYVTIEYRQELRRLL